MLSNIFTAIILISLVATPILFIAALINAIRRKPVKKILVSTLCSVCLFFIAAIINGAFLLPPTDSSTDSVQDSENKVHSSSAQQIESTNECNHVWIEIDRQEPTEEKQGVSYQKCENCGAEQQCYIPKLEHVITFDEIYREYKSNELRADEKYKNNRYTITATINGMATGGLLNWSGGATLTMETRVDNTIVFFYAEFEKDQEEALKAVNVGDEITFEGECLSAGSWVECELK